MTEQSGSFHYRPAIDGLRAIAVLSVLLFHLNPRWLPGGFVGVDVFFVISGFLIASILGRQLYAGQFSFRSFYQRRIARLYPAFFFLTILTLLAVWRFYESMDLSIAATGFIGAALSVANIRYMFESGGYFDQAFAAQPYLHTWSLSVEEQFYLVFPGLLFLLHKKVRSNIITLLMVLCLTSFAACIVVTAWKPVWAFYSPATRAWELLSGAILALHIKRYSVNLSAAGLALILLSTVFVHEGNSFPGFQAAFPVLGTIFFLAAPTASRNLSERLLSAGPLVFIGKMSYSLYLWHWPVFCLVDYRLYLWPAWERVILKLLLSVAGTLLTYFFIESPGRTFLNRPQQQRLAFASLVVGLIAFVPLARALRSQFYVSTKATSIHSGGETFYSSDRKTSLVLMGDSNASMYGTAIRDIAETYHLNLNVISLAAGDVMPHPGDSPSQTWLDSLDFVKKRKPETVIFVCAWLGKLSPSGREAQLALASLAPYVHRVIVLTQPPSLPAEGLRAAIRQGARPPFWEDAAKHTRRLQLSATLMSLTSDSVTVLDIEPLFSLPDGSVRFSTPEGRLLYFDRTHLNAIGANLVKADLIKAIFAPMPPARLSTGPGQSSSASSPLLLLPPATLSAGSPRP